MLNVKLSLLNGTEYNLSHVPQECTVANLIRVIAPSVRMNVRQIRLIRNGRQLADDATLIGPPPYNISLVPRQGGYSPFPGWKPVSRFDPYIGGIRVDDVEFENRPLAPNFDDLNPDVKRMLQDPLIDTSSLRSRYWFPLNYINHRPGSDIPVSHHLLQQFYDTCIAQPFQSIEDIGTAILLANGYRHDPDINMWFVPHSPAAIARHNPPALVLMQFQPMVDLARMLQEPAHAVAALPVAHWPHLVHPDHHVPVQAGPILGSGIDQSSAQPTTDWVCSICRENETENGNVIYTVPCGHKFHVQCISGWIGTHNTCPDCRIVITGYSNVSIAGHTLGKRKTFKKRTSKRKFKKRSNKKH
jgi:hypothetical protein